MSVTEYFKVNIHKDFSLQNKKISIPFKCDEHVNRKIRYHPRINEPVGLCYQHCNKVRKNFNSFEDADLIQQKLVYGHHQKLKECLVAGVASLTHPDPFNIILIWPSCTKKDFSSMVIWGNFSRFDGEKWSSTPQLLY